MDAIVVVVNGEAITASRIQFMAAYLEVTGGDGIGRPLAVYGPLSPEVARQVVEDDALLTGMADRLPVIEVRDEEILSMRRWFQGAFVSPEAFAAFTALWGFGEAEQVDFFARRLRVQKFVDLKIGAYAAIPDRELQAWYSDRSSQFGGRPFQEVREDVARAYDAERREERFRDWMAAYRKDHPDALRIPARGGDQP